MPLGHSGRSRRHSRLNNAHQPTVFGGWGAPPGRDWSHRALCGCPYHCEPPEERPSSRPVHGIISRQPSRESSGLGCRLPCRGWTPELQPSLPPRHHFHFPSPTGRTHGPHRAELRKQKWQKLSDSPRVTRSRGMYRMPSTGPECPPIPSRFGTCPQSPCQAPHVDGGLYSSLYQPPTSSRLFRLPPRYTHYRVPQNYPEHQYFYPSSSELLPFPLQSPIPRRNGLDP